MERRRNAENNSSSNGYGGTELEDRQVQMNDGLRRESALRQPIYNRLHPGNRKQNPGRTAGHR